MLGSTDVPFIAGAPLSSPWQQHKLSPPCWGAAVIAGGAPADQEVSIAAGSASIPPALLAHLVNCGLPNPEQGDELLQAAVQGQQTAGMASVALLGVHPPCQHSAAEQLPGGSSLQTLGTAHAVFRRQPSKVRC